jgi:hypothetical protein
LFRKIEIFLVSKKRRKSDPLQQKFIFERICIKCRNRLSKTSQEGAAVVQGSKGLAARAARVSPAARVSAGPAAFSAATTAAWLVTRPRTRLRKVRRPWVNKSVGFFFITNKKQKQKTKRTNKKNKQEEKKNKVLDKTQPYFFFINQKKTDVRLWIKRERMPKRKRTRRTLRS